MDNPPAFTPYFGPLAWADVCRSVSYLMLDMNTGDIYEFVVNEH